MLLRVSLTLVWLLVSVETRKANDNLIVTYTNATFYPNRIASLAVDSTAGTTAAHTYNPLPACDCNCC